MGTQRGGSRRYAHDSAWRPPIRRLLLALLAILLSLGIAAVVFVATTDWSAAGAWLEEQADARLDGRTLHIEGSIRPHFSLRPGLVLTDARIDNPPGSREPLLAEARYFAIYIDLLHWLRTGQLRVVSALARDARVVLGGAAEQAESGEGTTIAEELRTLRSLLGRHRIENVSVEIVRDQDQPFRLEIEDGSLRQCGQPISLRAGVNQARVALSGTLRCLGVGFGLDDLDATIGDSDLGGRFELDLSQGTRLRGTLHSERLVLEDLASAFRTGPPNPTPWSERILPFRQLGALDGALDLDVAQLELGPQTWVDVAGHLSLEHGRLEAQVDRATADEGSLTGTLRAVGGGADPSVALSARLEAASVAELSRDPEMEGKAGIELDASGVGETPRALLATTTGAASLAADRTRLSGDPLHLLGRDLFGILEGQFDHDDEKGVLNCAVVRTDLQEGLGRVGVVLDTPSATVAGGGRLDLRRLEADVVLKPRPKRPSVGAIKTPIRIHGPLGQLRAELDKKALAKTTGVTLGLALVNPFLIVVPFVDLGTGNGNPCEAALEAATAEPPPDKGLLGRTKDAAQGLGDWIVRGGDRAAESGASQE